MAAILMKFAPMGPFMTELYPTNIRGTGQGFCYNAGRAIGSVFMTAIGFATAVTPLGSAIALFSTLAHALGTYFVGVPDVTTLPLIMFTASLAGNYQIAAVTALILLVPSIAFMLLIERFLNTEVLAKVG